MTDEDELFQQSRVCWRLATLDLNFVDDMLDLGNLLREVLGFLTFLISFHGAFESERLIVNGVVDILQFSMCCEGGLVTFLDCAVELGILLGGLDLALQSRVLHLNTIDDGILRSGLPRELFGRLLPIAGPDNSAEGYGACPAVLRDSHAAKIVLTERVVDGHSDVRMRGMAATEHEGAGDESSGSERQSGAQ